MSADNTSIPESVETNGATDSSATTVSTDTGTKQKQELEMLRDKFWEDEAIREWERREPSRRYDRDQWLRINGRCW